MMQNQRLLAACERINNASREACDLALDALHDTALQNALFRRVNDELAKTIDNDGDDNSNVDRVQCDSAGVRDHSDHYTGDSGLLRAITYLKIRVLAPGLHPDESLVEFRDANGDPVQTFAWTKQMEIHGLRISPPLNQRHTDHAYFIELPNETIGGAWHAWVLPDDLLQSQIGTE